MNTVRFFQQKNAIDVFKHDLVIMGFTVKLSKLAVEIKWIFASRHKHWQVLHWSDHFTRELTNSSCFYNLVIEKTSSSNIVAFFFLFTVVIIIVSTLTLGLSLSFPFSFSLFFFLFFINLKFIVGYMESDFTKSVNFGVLLLLLILFSVILKELKSNFILTIGTS